MSRYLFLAGSLPYLLLGTVHALATSHSLGLVVLGALIVLIGQNEATFRAQASIFVPFALLASAAYLVLAIKYWFRIPIIGCALSVALLLSSWLALLLETR